MTKLITSLAGLAVLAGCSCATNEKKPTASAATTAGNLSAAHPAPGTSRPHGAKLEEYKEQGKALGFRLRSIEPDSQWAKRGLLDGDVVVGVNGDPVDPSEGPLGLFSLVQSGEGIAIDILRADPKSGKLSKRTLGAK